MKKSIFTFLFTLLVASLFAQAPQAFKYQAVARDISGNLISNQSIGFRISLLQNSPTGATVYSESHNVASNNLGLVNLDIGAGTPVSGNFSIIDWGIATYYVKVEMDASGGTNYLLMGTSQLLSVPYALHAATAGSVANDSDQQTLNLSGNTLSISNGNSVTLPSGGTSYSAGNGIDIIGNVISNTAQDQIVTLSASGSASVSGTYPNFTLSSTDNQTLALNGTTLSISGGNSVTLASGGAGTLDNAYDFGGAGAGRNITVDNGPVALTVNGTNAIGLRSDLNNTGTAIIANSNTVSNTFSAIQASSNANSNIASAIIGNSSGLAWGVSGQITNTATAEAALYGSSLRTNGGHGVLGIGLNGVVGQTNYSQGYGLYAENFDNIAPLGNGVGVAGRGYYGVLGEDRYTGGVGGAYGVFSNGNFGATGTKTFIIDHPKDPANKVLRHFSVESNEVLNIYRGNAFFDENGEAKVELPDYFSDINRRPTYQLTPVGGPGNLYIKKKIENGRFVIAGGEAGMEVSWTVTAERNDAYLQQNPHQREVEIEKREGQKGKYFMPQLYGQSLENGMFKSIEKTKQKEMNIQK